MQYDSLQDVPEDQIERAMLFMGAALRLTRSRTADRIAQSIVNECLLHGECRLSHKEFERRTGSCRRTVSRALQNLLSAKLIERIDFTDDRRSVYRCLWERADEHREWGKEFDLRWEEARGARRLKDFEAPAYPSPGASNGEA
ncbi:MarR family transcriptional regulator [Brucella anthropi]|uniref:Helix-turn-helix domain-containing protein n=1 Tax=Brucella anthropi TaxID=529 RepID=A0A6L3YZY8_BRUAN|nr:helix-turn-helix domain-containing protein [Brucella anthropi]KAB2761988.1 hypothetical protein F9L04_23060 [Brucella anthropi]UVV66704.1 MarR family transcriptional regulator [Brucella anthropi]